MPESFLGDPKMTASRLRRAAALGAASLIAGAGLVGLAAAPAYAVPVADTTALNTAILADEAVIDITGSFTLTADIELIDYDVTINGNGFTIDADGYDAFDVFGSATVSDLTVVDADSAGFFVDFSDGDTAVFTDVSTEFTYYGIYVDVAEGTSVEITGGSHVAAGYGVYVDNDSDYKSDVTITGTSFEDIGDYGIYVYELYDDSALEITDVTLTDVYYGIYVDDAYDDSTIAIDGTVVTAGPNTGDGSGYGIYLEGYDDSVITITDTSVTGEVGEGDSFYDSIWVGQYDNNETVFDGVTLSGNYYGFYIDNYDDGATTEIRNSVASGNYYNGIYVCDLAGSLLVDSTTIDGNGVEGYVGIDIDSAYEDSVIEISRSTISNNGYGGILFDGYDDNVILAIVDSTISGNDADGGEGDDASAVTIDGNGYSQEVYIVSSTITANVNVFAGLAIVESENVVVSHSIISGNGAEEADFYIDEESDAFVEWSIIGTVTDESFAAVSDLEAAVAYAGDGVIIAEDPGLEPLADNGGPTLTHSLLSTSPALDGGNPELGATDVSETDQRGEARISGSAIDIGAVEIDQTLPATGAESAAGLAAALALLLGGLALLGYRTLRRRMA